MDGEREEEEEQKKGRRERERNELERSPQQAIIKAFDDGVFFSLSFLESKNEEEKKTTRREKKDPFQLYRE